MFEEAINKMHAMLFPRIIHGHFTVRKDDDYFVMHGFGPGKSISGTARGVASMLVADKRKKVRR
jgi:hypothetical protein